MINEILQNLKFLVSGSIPVIIMKITYTSLLLIFFINIINWTYRRTLCVFDAGWASYSIRNLFRLIFCLIFLLLSGFSLVGMFIPENYFIANPYMIFIISVNALYTVTLLGSSYLQGHLKARIISNTFLFSTWCISIVALYILSIRPYYICTPAIRETTLWAFGLTVYKKLNPFFLGNVSIFYTTFFTIFINIYNFICILVILIFSKKIKGLKEKLQSFKYILAIDISVLLRDILYYSLNTTTLISSSLCTKVIGSCISILLIITTCYFIKFIQCEGKYDKNLKKKQIKDLKRDLNDIILDFERIGTDKEYYSCKKRISSLQRRIEILNIKVDITKLIKIKNPELHKSFEKLIEEALIFD